MSQPEWGCGCYQSAGHRDDCPRKSDLDRALAWAREIARDDEPDGPSWRRLALARALLAEHERAESYKRELDTIFPGEAERDPVAEANAADARRWRTIRDYGTLTVAVYGKTWRLEANDYDLQRTPIPTTVDAAADALADQQEASHE